jgi:hypothetical protein
MKPYLPLLLITLSATPAGGQCRCIGPLHQRVRTPSEAAESTAVIHRAGGALFVGVAGPTVPRRIAGDSTAPIRPAFPFRVEREWAGALADTVTTFGSVRGYCGDPQFIAGRRYVVRAWRERDSLIVGDCVRADEATPALMDRMNALFGRPRILAHVPETTLRARADSAIIQLIEGINRRDAALVATLTVHHGEQPDTVVAREAIDDFRHYFRGQRLTGYAFTGVHGRLPGAMHFQYQLLSARGVRKTVVAYYDGSIDRLRLYDEFLSYSARARALVRAVIVALRTRDAPRLARLFTPDDIDYPVPLAERVIARYAGRLDLGTLRYRFDGLTPERPVRGYPSVNRWFRYTILGTKNGAPVEHRVVLIHGDGLVGWRDDLVPRPPD